MNASARSTCAHSGAWSCQSCGASVEELQQHLVSNINKGQGMILRLEQKAEEVEQDAADLRGANDALRNVIARWGRVFLELHGEPLAVNLTCFPDLDAVVSEIRKGGAVR